MHRRLWIYTWFCIILAFGLWLRARDLAGIPLTGDEGESAINALTILQTGTPRGTYMGLPIYENCLTESWPDHPEYEFRDSSYSSKDLAIYHGWLPLYLMAASQRAFGVTPDTPLPELSIRHSDAEIRTRVLAPRIPSVVFGGLFLIFLFLAARQMFGVDAGLAAMLVGAVGRPFVYMAREARYHSATLALTTACCWSMWRVYRYGRWLDYFITAGLLTLLFYTHLLGFMIACAMFAVAAFMARHHSGVIQKFLAAVLIIAACTAPWVLLTGFLNQTTHIPPARHFLSFPADLIYYPLVRVPYLILPMLGLVWLAVVFFFHRRIPRFITRPLDRHQRQIAFLLAWIALGIVLFTLLVPAASYFYKRLTLAVMGPGVIWGSILFAAAARAWTPKISLVLAPLAFLAAILAGSMAHLWFLEEEDRTEIYGLIPRLRAMHLTPDTKLYCTPNHQLAITYMTGLPVQSVAPIRKKFLDTYPGPILLIDSAPPYEPVAWWEIRNLVRSYGKSITDDEARQSVPKVIPRQRRLDLAGHVASIESTTTDEPAFGQAVSNYQVKLTAKSLDKFTRKGANNPLLRAYNMRSWADWWPIFFYRFVDPPSRMGEHLNYADRIKTAHAIVLPTAWVIFQCPPLSPAH